MRALDPEFRLLLAAASGTERREGTEALDWQRLTRLAAAHGVAPLVLRYLGGSAPVGALADLRREAQAASHHGLLLVSRLLRILERFEQASLPVLPYKGPTLAVEAYGKLALRPFVDLDLLVHPQDLPRATELLLDLGYDMFPKLTPARHRSFFRSECECWFDFPDHSSPVEIHWAVRERLFSFPLEVSGIFQRSRRTTLCGKEVPTMAAEDLLPVLCIHGAKHGWSQLKWICDVDRILATSPDLDWSGMLERVRALRGERLLLLGLAVAQEVLGTRLPEIARERISADGVALQLARSIASWLWLDASETPGKLGEASVYLRSREDFRDRLRYCAGMLFTPTLADWQALSLPDALFPFYYLYRPLRLSGERLRALLPGRRRHLASAVSA